MTNILFNVMTSINKSIDLIRERVVLDHTKRKWVRIISRNISERLPAEKVKEAEEFTAKRYEEYKAIAGK